MARRAAKVDRNQAEIVAALRKVGCTVAQTHTAGEGFPDLAVGYRGKTFLLEVKDGSLSPSRQSLTTPQVKWHEEWRGHVAIVRSIDEAFAAVGCGAVNVPLRGTIS